jgi:hypothetical protein
VSKKTQLRGASYKDGAYLIVIRAEEEFNHSDRSPKETP